MNCLSSCGLRGGTGSLLCGRFCQSDFVHGLESFFAVGLPEHSPFLEVIVTEGTGRMGLWILEFVHFILPLNIFFIYIMFIFNLWIKQQSCRWYCKTIQNRSSRPCSCPKPQIFPSRLFQPSQKLCAHADSISPSTPPGRYTHLQFSY